MEANPRISPGAIPRQTNIYVYILSEIYEAIRSNTLFDINDFDCKCFIGSTAMLKPEKGVKLESKLNLCSLSLGIVKL
jgi:hypothetical protein